MTGEDGFDATFSIQIDRPTAWRRLTETAAEGAGEGHVWLAGFDSAATVLESEPPGRLRVTKDDEPCAGTDIVVTLDDEGTGTRIHVVQSRFGDWLTERREMMAVGWRHIVSDLQTYLVTGVHARRFLRPFGDLAAVITVADGGLRIDTIRRDGLAARLGLADGDLLVELDGAPVTSLDDLVTILRVRGGTPTAAVWIRDSSLMSSPSRRLSKPLS